MLSPSLLTLILILIFHVWRVVGRAPPAPVAHPEYDGWRGKASLDVMDFVEISNLITKLNQTLDQALKYYWVNNEALYGHTALVRAMFAAFNETTKDKNISKAFLRGVEIILHYILIKSLPVLGRRGGIRGSGQDKVILRAAIPPLIACFNKTASAQNYSIAVFPIRRRRKKRRVLIRPVHFSKMKPHPGFKRGRRSDEAPEESDRPASDDSAPLPPPSWDEHHEGDAEGNGVNAEPNGEVRGRYAYTLSHGSRSKATLTNIVVAEDDTNQMENVAVTILWLIYELLPPLCQWTPAEIKPYKEAFDKILGLEMSMYLYDKADFGEQYERVFNMPTKNFESEWEKIEMFAKDVQRAKKLFFTKPYSDIL